MLMLDQRWRPAIHKASHQAAQQINPALRLPQQQRTTIARNLTGAELG
jgi:hypothetical protein